MILTDVDVCLHNQIQKVSMPERALFADKMNIFVLSEEPVLAAEMLCNKHVCKMSIEYAQLLLNAHTLVTGRPVKNPLDYQPVFLNHPCSKWVSDSLDNYYWLLRLTVATWAEHKYRFTEGDREHKCRALLDVVSQPPNGIPSFSTVATPPPQCVPDDYRISQTVAHANRWRNTVKAYRDYYVYEKARFARWTKREPPDWFLEGQLALKLDAETSRGPDAPKRLFKVIP